MPFTPASNQTSRQLLRQLLKTVSRFPIPSARSKLKYNVKHAFRLYQHERNPASIQKLHQQGYEINDWLGQFKEWPQKNLYELFRNVNEKQKPEV